MSDTQPTRGRPKSQKKREAVLDAARRLFLHHGADGVSLDTVIASAGVSKTYFYANFTDRSALLEAVIRREAERIVRHEDVTERVQDNLERELSAFGVRLLRLLTDPDLIGFERLIASASRAHPELADRFFEAGPGHAFRALVERITLGMRAGDLRPDDARQAGEDLVGLWQGFMRLEVSAFPQRKPSAPALQTRSARCVRIFMLIYGAKKRPQSQKK